MTGRARERATEAIVHDELLSTLAEITETRLNRATDREGWTIRHALAAVAASDRVLAHVLGSLAAESGAPGRFRFRRLRGEVMYEAHMLQRDALARLLQQTHAEAENALADHAALLDHPIEAEGDGARSVGDLLADRAKRERAALGALRQALPPGQAVRRTGGQARPA